MNPKSIPLSRDHLSNDSSQPGFFFKSFLRTAWQKSLTFAETLMNFPARSSKSQKILSTQTQQKTTPTQQLLGEIQSKRSTPQALQKIRLQSNIQMEPHHHSHDFSQLFSSTNSTLQKFSKNQGIKFPKKRIQQRQIVLLIPSERGRFNVSEVFKKIRNQKQQKVNKQSLKISRSQFISFHTHPVNDELQGKTLKQIFLPNSQKNKLDQKAKIKVQTDLEKHQKDLKKTPVEGVVYGSEQKMINEGSSNPIVFRGDLSTILQSSNQDISRDKEIDKGFVLADKGAKIQLKKEYLLEVREQKQIQKKSNPFLTSMRKDNLSNQEGKGDVIEAMRKKLFDKAFGANDVQRNQNLQKKQIVRNIIVSQNLFGKKCWDDRNILENPLSNESSKISQVGLFGPSSAQNKNSLISPSFIRESFPASNMRQIPFSMSNAKTELMKSHVYTQECSIPPNNSLGSNLGQQGMIMNGALFDNKGVEKFTNNFQANVTPSITSGQSNTKKKEILNTFIQPPSTCNQSLFDQKGEKQTENKKKERKEKKRGKKEERIRG